MNKLIKSVITAIFVFAALALGAVSAFAADDDASTIDGAAVEKNLSATATGKLDAEGSIIKDSLKPAAIFKYYPDGDPGNGVKGQTYSVTVSFVASTGDAVTKEVEIWLPDAQVKSQKLESATGSGTVGNKIRDYTQEVNIEPDVAGATLMMSGFIPILNIFVGLIVWAILSVLFLSAAIDILYIALPSVQEKCDNMRDNGGVMAHHDKKSGEDKVRFISREAVRAVNDSNLSMGKSPYKIYLGDSILKFVMIAVLLTLLLTGQINVIMEVAVKAVNGLVEVIKRLL
jgi:hypothetical protein